MISLITLLLLLSVYFGQPIQIFPLTFSTMDNNTVTKVINKYQRTVILKTIVGLTNNDSFGVYIVSSLNRINKHDAQLNLNAVFNCQNCMAQVNYNILVLHKWSMMRVLQLNITSMSNTISIPSSYALQPYQINIFLIGFQNSTLCTNNYLITNTKLTYENYTYNVTFLRNLSSWVMIQVLVISQLAYVECKVTRNDYVITSANYITNITKNDLDVTQSIIVYGISAFSYQNNTIDFNLSTNTNSGIYNASVIVINWTCLQDIVRPTKYAIKSIHHKQDRVATVNIILMLVLALTLMILIGRCICSKITKEREEDRLPDHKVINVQI